MHSNNFLRRFNFSFNTEIRKKIVTKATICIWNSHQRDSLFHTEEFHCCICVDFLKNRQN